MGEREEAVLYWKQQEATVYSMYLNPQADLLNHQEKAEILTYLPNLEGMELLELASGIGRFTRHLATQAKQLISVDLVPQFVEKNRQDHADLPNVTFLCADALDLHFEEQTFDFIFFNWLLMYLEDEEVEILMRRIRRWLKPSGELFFRESCAVTRYARRNNGYYAHYRTLKDYDSLIERNDMARMKEGHIKTYVDLFANPMQCFWHCTNRLA